MPPRNSAKTNLIFGLIFYSNALASASTRWLNETIGGDAISTLAMPSPGREHRAGH